MLVDLPVGRVALVDLARDVRQVAGAAVERRHGERYAVSPYALIINEGNYYLLAFDDKRQKMMWMKIIL